MAELANSLRECVERFKNGPKVGAIINRPKVGAVMRTARLGCGETEGD